MEKEEIEFIKDRIKELEKFQKKGITNIAWFDGKSFSVRGNEVIKNFLGSEFYVFYLEEVS